ncbi:MAG: T9SS type A sorting domain-containing protein [Deferribacteres bacterium]|nr:T9SS type A sorting domain-containing protein [candidate division KSB1 bacterium]MCB9502602.1 T9SS type A sorting domain-containing protein [Deferribacteres bacterium]
MKKMRNLLVLLAVLNSQIVAGTWDNAAFLNIPRAGASAISWQGKIYVFGGKSLNYSVLNTVEIYDRNTGIWDASYAAPFHQARYNASTVLWNDKVYLLGGRTINDVLKNVEVYDLVQNTWTDAHDLRIPREGHSACFFNDRIYAIGGQDKDAQLVESIEWYDNTKDNWEDAVFELPYARSAHFSAVYANDYFMFGGYYWGLTKYIYKAQLGYNGYEWQQIGELSEPRAYGATAQIDSLIFIIGGETHDDKTNLVEIFNVKTGELTRGDDMNMSHSGMATAVLDNQIYSIGGYEKGSNVPINHVHRYTFLTDSVNDGGIENVDVELSASAYPNPFSSRVRLLVDSATNKSVEVTIFNARGQAIRCISGSRNGNRMVINWDGEDTNGNLVPAGIYFAVVRAGKLTKTVKLTYVK